MKRLVLLLLTMVCFSFSAFADTKELKHLEKELKNLEKKIQTELDKKNYKKAIEISKQLIEKSKKDNALSFYAVHNKNLGEIYLNNTKEYEKAWNHFIEASNYYNPVAFMRLSEMSFNGIYVKKEPDFAIVLLGLAIDSLKVTRKPIYWSKKINEQDEVGEILIDLNRLISNIYHKNKELVKGNSMAMGYVYELCIEGTPDTDNPSRIYCDSKLAINSFNKVFSEGNPKDYFTSYAEYKILDLLLRYKSAIYGTYLDSGLTEEAKIKKKEILEFIEETMSNNDIPFTYISIGLQFEEFENNEKAKEMYSKAFAKGAIEQAYTLYDKLDTKK